MIEKGREIDLIKTDVQGQSRVIVSTIYDLGAPFLHVSLMCC